MKLNVYLELDSDTENWVRVQNARIRRLTRSVVNFAQDSSMVPHVTLTMGNLHDGATLDQLCAAITNVAASEAAFPSCRPTSFYLEQERGKYIFLDFSPSAQFLSLKQKMISALQTDFLIPESEYAAVPHITVAHVEADQQSVCAALESVPLPPSCGFGVLALGRAGPKGTVVSRIRSWDFGSNAPVSAT